MESLQFLNDEIQPGILPHVVEVGQDLVVGDGEHYNQNSKETFLFDSLFAEFKIS